MCDYCGDMDNTHRPLIENVVGNELIRWFEESQQKTAVEATVIESNWDEDWTTYRIVFHDDSVEDHKVYWDGHTTNIVETEMFNKVI